MKSSSVPNLDSIFETGEWSDVTVRLIDLGKGGEPIVCALQLHRAVLCSGSDYMKALFSGSFADSAASEVDLETESTTAARQVLARQESASAASRGHVHEESCPMHHELPPRSLLRFLYSGVLSLNLVTVREVMRLAAFLGVDIADPLERYCLKAIREAALPPPRRLELALTLLQYSADLGQAGLRDICLSFAAPRFPEALASGLLAALSVEPLIALLGRDDLALDPRRGEGAVLDSILQWAEAAEGGTPDPEDLRRLVGCVRVHGLTPAAATELVQRLETSCPVPQLYPLLPQLLAAEAPGRIPGLRLRPGTMTDWGQGKGHSCCWATSPTNAPQLSLSYLAADSLHLSNVPVGPSTTAMAVSSRGGYHFAAGSSQGGVMLGSLHSGVLGPWRHILGYSDVMSNIWALAFSADGKLLVGGGTGLLFFSPITSPDLSLANIRVFRFPPAGRFEEIYAVAPWGDSGWWLAAGESGRILLANSAAHLELAQGDEELRAAVLASSPEGSPIWDLAVSPCGGWLVAASRYNLTVWRISGGGDAGPSLQLVSSSDPCPCSRLAFSPDGARLAVACYPGRTDVYTRGRAEVHISIFQPEEEYYSPLGGTSFYSADLVGIIWRIAVGLARGATLKEGGADPASSDRSSLPPAHASRSPSIVMDTPRGILTRWAKSGCSIWHTGDRRSQHSGSGPSHARLSS